MTTETTPAVAGPRPAAPPRPRAPVVLGALVLAASLGGGGYYVLGLGHERTDDAFVEGRVVNVSPRVAGQVAKVLVVDNQDVKEGDVLVELDPADLTARRDAAAADLQSARAQLESAEAQLALTEKNAEANVTQAQGGLEQATSGVTATRSQLEQARADLAAAESRLSLTRTELARTKSLFATGAVSQAEVDARQAAFDQADAATAQARARLATTQASIEGSVGGVTLAKGRVIAAQTGPQQVAAARAAAAVSAARVKQAEAALRIAELNVSYTAIRAPSKGVVARRNVEVGQLVDPSRPLLALVPLHDVWVVANFKEDQLRAMKPGERGTVKIDAYGGLELPVHVDSLAGGTGSRFALLPPDNASGNFVKVVQRVPVLLRFEQPPPVVLRPGMSVLADVVTRDGR